MGIKYFLKGKDKTFIYMHLIMIMLFLAISGFSIVVSRENRSIIVLVCSIFLIIASFRHYLLHNREKNIILWVLPYVEFFLIVYLVSIDQSDSIVALIPILAMDIIIDYKLKYGISFCLILYAYNMYIYILSYRELPLSNMLILIAIGAFQFLLFNGFAFLAKKYSIQRAQLERTTAELHSKMINMEQITVLKERNRIAGEIHNTVGHQLTTALVQIGATQMIIDNDKEEAKKRLEVIRGQIGEGLKELQKSIQAINAEEEYGHFEKAIKELMEKVQNHTGVCVDLEMESVEEINLSLKKTLYHVILESITNGIRHGYCDEITIKLSNEEGVITLQSFNNGMVPTDLKYGYGLNHIKEKMKEIGGSLIMKINKDGWFGLIVKFPVYYGGGKTIG